MFENGDIVTTLETPLTSDGVFQTPWTIPNDLNVGSYTIEISDNQNIDTVVISIQ